MQPFKVTNAKLTKPDNKLGSSLKLNRKPQIKKIRLKIDFYAELEDESENKCSCIISFLLTDAVTAMEKTPS